MKYLRLFPDVETRDEVLANVNYGVLSVTEDDGIIKIKPDISSFDLPLLFALGDGIHTYYYNYDPDIVVNDLLLQVKEDHPETSGLSYDIYKGPEGSRIPLDASLTLLENNVHSGDQITFVGIFN